MGVAGNLCREDSGRGRAGQIERLGGARSICSGCRGQPLGNLLGRNLDHLTVLPDNGRHAFGHVAQEVLAHGGLERLVEVAASQEDGGDVLRAFLSNHTWLDSLPG